MRNVLFVMALFVSVLAYSQGLSEGLKAKNDGNKAYRLKDYVLAIEKWENYFSSGEVGIAADTNTLNLYVRSLLYSAEGYVKKQDFNSAFIYYEKYFLKAGKKADNDGRTAFNMAFSAFKLKKYDVAKSYFQKSVDLGYKSDLCKLYLANIYRIWGNEGMLKEVLISAIEQHPGSKYIDKMALLLQAPLLREASIPFNQANELAKAASISTPADYETNTNLAREKFQESIPLFEKVLKYNPRNKQAIDCIIICKDNLR